MLLPLVFIALSAETGFQGAASPRAPYFADQIEQVVQPLVERMDLSNDKFLTVQTPDGALEIKYQTIQSLSFSRRAVAAGPQSGSVFHRLLTIGFETESGVHHNLVIELDSRTEGTTLKMLAFRTSLRVGEPPAKFPRSNY
jgi:hypothetical protein